MIPLRSLAAGGVTLSVRPVPVTKVESSALKDVAGPGRETVREGQFDVIEKKILQTFFFTYTNNVQASSLFDRANRRPTFSGNSALLLSKLLD